MVVHGLRRDVEAVGDLRVLEIEQHHHLELASSQPGGVVAGGGARSSADAAGAALAEAARDVAGGGHSAEELELCQRLAQGLLVVALGQRERRLIGAAEAPPLFRRLLPFAADLLGETFAAKSDWETDALLELLRNEKVMLLDDAVRHTELAPDKIKVFASQHPDRVCYFDGEHPVVCLAVAPPA